MLGDRVVLFSGNGAFCGNRMSELSGLAHLDYCGVPPLAGNPRNHKGGEEGGDGSTHSYRNRKAMLRVVDYAEANGLELGNGEAEHAFFVRVMQRMNALYEKDEKRKIGKSINEEPFRLANPEEMRRFGGVSNLSDATSLLHLPVVASGTCPKLGWDERETLLKHCPELRMVFPTMHEPACFGAHPDSERCRASICALRDGGVPKSGC